MTDSLLGKFRTEAEKAARRSMGPSVTTAERPSDFIEFVKLDGETRTALPTSFLHCIDLEPSTGIRLRFASHEVILTGKRLRTLYDALLNRSVSAVAEVDELRIEVGDDVSVVSLIEVTPVG